MDEFLVQQKVCDCRISLKVEASGEKDKCSGSHERTRVEGRLCKYS